MFYFDDDRLLYDGEGGPFCLLVYDLTQDSLEHVLSMFSGLFETVKWDINILSRCGLATLLHERLLQGRTVCAELSRGRSRAWCSLEATREGALIVHYELQADLLEEVDLFFENVIETNPSEAIRGAVFEMNRHQPTVNWIVGFAHVAPAKTLAAYKLPKFDYMAGMIIRADRFQLIQNWFCPYFCFECIDGFYRQVWPRAKKRTP